MNASWQSVVAGIAKGLIALSVLPVRQRWLPVSLIALLPALLVIVTWVIPQGYQSLDIRQRIVLLEHKIGEPGRLHAARPSGFKEVWQHVVAKFPHWQQQHAEHRWLGGLVELGAEHRLRTLKLESTGGRTLPRVQVKQSSPSASSTGFTAPMLTQQGFVWQMQGTFIDVLMVLDVLTSVATQIDAFSVEWLADTATSVDSRPSGSSSVRVDLKFRLYVHERKGPTDNVGMALGPKFELTELARPSRWRDIKALTSNAGEYSLTCQPVTRGSLGFVATGPSGIFLEEDVQDIRLVGVIEAVADSGQSRLRGVFRNGRGAFAIAALHTRLSTQGYRLVLLDRQRAVLQAPQPEGKETVNQDALVLDLRPTPSVAAEGIVLHASARHSQ
jgi:hypothetical protein